MFTSINLSHVWVLDQDEAKDFYVNKLGLECSNDLDLGVMRWLTVRVPGTEGRDILLELPSGPAVDPDSATKIRGLVSKGATGFNFGLVTDDIRKTYETLKERGVEFTDEPTERDYGTDCGARDPFGNHFRIVQPKRF